LKVVYVVVAEGKVTFVNVPLATYFHTHNIIRHDDKSNAEIYMQIIPRKLAP